MQPDDHLPNLASVACGIPVDKLCILSAGGVLHPFLVDSPHASNSKFLGPSFQQKGCYWLAIIPMDMIIL